MLPPVYIISVAPAPGQICCFGTFYHHRDCPGLVTLQLGGREMPSLSGFFVTAILVSVWESCGEKTQNNLNFSQII